MVYHQDCDGRRWIITPFEPDTSKDTQECRYYARISWQTNSTTPVSGGWEMSCSDDYLVATTLALTLTPSCPTTPNYTYTWSEWTPLQKYGVTCGEREQREPVEECVAGIGCCINREDRDPEIRDQAACTSQTSTTSTNQTAVAAIVAVSVILLLIAVGLLVRHHRRENFGCNLLAWTPATRRELRLAKELAAATWEKAQLSFLASYSRRLFSTATSAADHARDVNELEVPRRALVFKGTLGEGNYGIVRLATLRRNHGSASMVDVAVKSRPIRETDATIDEALFIEGLVLHAVQHKHILALFGTCTASLPFLLVTELMVNGDLKTFLRMCRPSEPEASRKAVLTLLDMMEMIERVCGALKHLESVSVIHRDVAARNVLVGATPTDVKLGDLGAARSVFRLADREYSATTEHMPARWMAPESLKSATFTHKTDVWAFGVLCWEITSLGQTPYGVMGIKDMVDSLTNGDRLLEAASTPPGMYKMMALCWSMDPKRRPRFADLIHNTGAIRGAIAVSPEARMTLDAEGTLVSADTGATLPEIRAETATNKAPSDDDGYIAATGDYCNSVYQRVSVIAAELAPVGLPLAGLASTELVGFEVAMTSAVNHVTCSGGLVQKIRAAMQFAARAVEHGKACGLSVDQVAAIHLYTQPSIFYVALNGALGRYGAGGGAAIVHYLPYLKLLLSALDMLPEISAVVYRGVRNIALETLLLGKGVGDELVWWMVISATGTADVLRDPSFFGTEEQVGIRVVFVLTVDSAIRVKQFSELGSGLDDYLRPFGATEQDEDEHLLRPGTKFIIDSIQKMPSNVMEVRMHEVGRAAYGNETEGLAALAIEQPAANNNEPVYLRGLEMPAPPPAAVNDEHPGSGVGGAAESAGGYLQVAGVVEETSFDSRPNVDFTEGNYPGEATSLQSSASRPAEEAVYHLSSGGGSSSGGGKSTGSPDAVYHLANQETQESWMATHLQVVTAAGGAKTATLRSAPNDTTTLRSVHAHDYINVPRGDVPMQSTAERARVETLWTKPNLRARNALAPPPVSSSQRGKGIQRNAAARKGSVYEGFGAGDADETGADVSPLTAGGAGAGGSGSVDGSGDGANNSDAVYIRGLDMPTPPSAPAGGTITRARKQKSVYLGFEDEGTRL